MSLEDDTHTHTVYLALNLRGTTTTRTYFIEQKSSSRVNQFENKCQTKRKVDAGGIDSSIPLQSADDCCGVRLGSITEIVVPAPLIRAAIAFLRIATDRTDHVQFRFAVNDKHRLDQIA